YAMIRKADTLGTFQIESRAQMAMLPRMKPTVLYDLVIQVAIVRPGPIQGDMVHPYLRRREKREPVEYPTEALKRVLHKTLGVPLFQEQAMRVAIECAGFTAGEADQLRRAMATFKLTGKVSLFRDKLIGGMVANGYTPDFAEKTFRQLEGFGSYGFPESHAASFALIAYASAWVKCRHPDVFLAAILNSQPMGFYAPAQLVRDARAHGVEVLPPDVNLSGWDTRLEAARPGSSLEGSCPDGRGGGAPRSRLGGIAPDRAVATWRRAAHPGEGARPLIPVRLGLRLAKGLSNRDGARIVMARGDDPYSSVEDLSWRAGVPVAALTRLAEADAFGSLGLARRDALWAIKGLSDAPLPLFEAADAREARQAPEIVEEPVPLVPMTEARNVVEDYRSRGLSLRRHPVAFMRPELDNRGYTACDALKPLRNGCRVTVAGLVLVRQKPGSAKGVMFITIEDETDVANLVIWPSLFERQRRLILSASMIACRGKVQREGDVIHVVADVLIDLSDKLRAVGDGQADFPLRTGRGDEAAHGGSPDQRDRPPLGRKARDIYIPDLRLGSGIKIPTRDFR
ncbi:MAG: polymerase subunit alpha, partial [Enterovirga sp.]|nr:polymerase subunit alpha [Enterovirga sp.]